MPKPQELSIPEARRIALSAQGFGRRPARRSGLGDVRKVASRLKAIQIDSVNVLVRSHYLPAFSRLGAYPPPALDKLAYERRELFEYWGHMASLLPVDLHPLFRWRMDLHEKNSWGIAEGRTKKYVEAILGEVTERGPLSASELSDPGKRSGPWWGWAEGKRALEWLYSSGRVAVAGRRGFERLYDVAERIIPPEVLKIPTPDPAAAKRELLVLAAQALGIGTAKDISIYFHVDAWWDRSLKERKRSRPETPRIFDELVEEGRLKRVAVEGWSKPAFLDPRAKAADSNGATGLVSPFDSLVWERERTQRLFGFSYTIEIYVPKPKRKFGYYVLPFLLDGELVGRVDLKADRKSNTLLVPGAFAEPGQDRSRVAAALADELRLMSEWLGLEKVRVERRGNLASQLSRELKNR